MDFGFLLSWVANHNQSISWATLVKRRLMGGLANMTCYCGAQRPHLCPCQALAAQAWKAPWNQRGTGYFVSGDSRMFVRD